MTKEQTPAVDVKDLCFRYRESVIFDHVSFRVEEGESIGIIGPNGGGKTTLLRLLMGFLRPNHGIIRLFNACPHRALQDIAYVPQTLRFDRDFPISVLELVLSGRLSRLKWWGRYSESDYQAALETLDLVGLRHLQSHAFGHLSGGQAQRALIARALVSKPRLLILDEPTASVDSKAEAEIQALLRSLKGTMTMLTVTHDFRTAVELVDRVLCVQKGVISLKREQVCEHFAMGLYHPPLVQIPQRVET